MQETFLFYFPLIALWLDLDLMLKTLRGKWTCDIWSLEVFFFLSTGRTWIVIILMHSFSVCICFNTKTGLQYCFFFSLSFCSFDCICNLIQCIKKKLHSSMVKSPPLVVANDNNTRKHNSLKQTKAKQKQTPNCNWRFLHHYRQQPKAVTDKLGESLACFINMLFRLLWVDRHYSWPK